MKRLSLACLLALLFAWMAIPMTAAADEARPGPVIDFSTGTDVLITRSEKREFVTARAMIAVPLFANLTALGRLDLGGEQDAGGLDFSDFSSFRRIQGLGGLGYDVGALRVIGVAGATFSVEGEEGAPRDARLYTLALLARIALGAGGEAYVGAGHHGSVGGWAALGSFTIPTGPAFAVVDYAFPLRSPATTDLRPWVLRVGAQVRIKRIALTGRK